MIVIAAIALPALARAEIGVGDPFPDFSARDHTDALFQLSAHRGKVVLLHVCATLLLVDAIRNRTLVRVDNGVLPNQITAPLPATGHYQVVVGEQPLIARGARFRCAYCVSLESSAGAQDTLVPHAWVE